MPDLKDFLQNNETEMREQIAKKPFPGHKQINRHNETRPWSSQTDSLEFDDQSVDERIRTNPNLKNQAFLPLQIISEYKRTLLALIVFAAAIFFPVAIFYPTTYFSIQQTFIPERGDTISSRLNLLSNRIEFASFPTESKLPTSLVVRRLNAAEARQWVIQKIYTEPEFDSTRASLNPDAISIEVTYDPGLETLTLIGFANTAEWSAKVTQLYWQYFLKIDKDLDANLQNKMNRWADALNEKIDNELHKLTEQIESNAKNSKSGVELNFVQNTLSESYASQELTRSHLMQQYRELQIAKNTLNLDRLNDSSDPDISSLIQIRKQLIASPESAYYFRRIEEIEQQIPAMIRQKLSQVELQLKNIDQVSSNVKGQLARNQNLETKEIISNEKNNFVKSQLVALKEQKADLTKLMSQISLEASLNGAKEFRILTPSVPNENSLRPSRSVRYALAFLASILVPLTLIFSFATLTRKYK